MTKVSARKSLNAVPYDAADKKTRVVTVRCSSAQRQQMRELAAGQGFSIGAYIRTIMLGTAGPRSRRRPSLDHEIIGRLLGHIGHIGANLNQLARALNTYGDLPAQSELARAASDIAVIRAALMQALGSRPAMAPMTVVQASRLGHQG